MTSSPNFRFRARGRFVNATKNKTEAEYEQMLELRKRAGEIEWYRFEGIKVRLGEGAYYTPDFAVLSANGYLEMHEVKGFWREAAKVRIRTAMELYPFRFVVVKRKGPMNFIQEEL